MRGGSRVVGSVMRRAIGLSVVSLLLGGGACTGAGTDDGGAGRAPGAGMSGSTGGAARGGAGGASNGAAAGAAQAATSGAAGSAVGGVGGAGGTPGAAGSGVAAGAGGSAGRAGADGSAGLGGSGGRGGAGASGNDAGMAGSGDDGGSPNAPTLTSFTLTVLGSSTAAGEGASSSSQGWVNLLAGDLERTIVGDYATHNLAVGGYTTAELVPDSGASGSIDDALETEPDLIIVALAGSNDLSAGTSTSTFLSRLTSIRDHAREAGVPVFFLSTAPKDLSTEEKQMLRDWGDEMETRFSSCWVPGQSDYSPCFVDVFEPLANGSLGVASEYSAGDGIHLNDAGHALIFETVRDVVRPYVCSRIACAR